MGNIMTPFAAIALAWTVGAASADVFHMPAGETSLLTVPVGDAGNAGNYGAVAYNYQIGEYEVTAAQYCQFLSCRSRNKQRSLCPVEQRHEHRRLGRHQLFWQRR